MFSVLDNTHENRSHTHFFLPNMLTNTLKQMQTAPNSETLLSEGIRSRSLGHQVGSGFVCGGCDRTYKLKSSLRNHQKWECGKEPRFQCPACDYKAKQKMHMVRHMVRMHNGESFLNKENNSLGKKEEQKKVPNDSKRIQVDKKLEVLSGGTFTEKSESESNSSY